MHIPLSPLLHAHGRCDDDKLCLYVVVVVVVANIYGIGLGRLAEKLIILYIYIYIYVKKTAMYLLHLFGLLKYSQVLFLQSSPLTK